MSRLSIILIVFAALAAGIIGNIVANQLESVLNENPRYRFIERRRKLAISLVLFALFSIPSVLVALNEESVPNSAPGVTLAPTSAMSPSLTLTPTVTSLSVILTPTPTETLRPTIMPVTVGFDFETDVVGWGTSEDGLKVAELITSTEFAHSGSSSMRVTTELFGNASKDFLEHNSEDFYRHTEVTAYLNRVLPQGLDAFGPYDLSGKRVSCFIYLPSGLIDMGNRPAYARLVVKDVDFHNHFSPPTDIVARNVDTWLQLAFIVGVASSGHAPEPNFDPSQVLALGIRIDTADVSTLSYTGPVYVDDCNLQYP